MKLNFTLPYILDIDNQNSKCKVSKYNVPIGHKKYNFITVNYLKNVYPYVKLNLKFNVNKILYQGDRSKKLKSSGFLFYKLINKIFVHIKTLIILLLR